uniref:hypothetical protein n=1 Tax=Actinoplanes sp. RD1 TaxID=3064538 RepID=UPI00274097C6
TFSGHLDQMIPAAAGAVGHWYVTDVVADAVMDLARQTVEWGKDLLAWFQDLLKGAVAPVYMFIDAWNWADVKAHANGVAANLSEQNLAVDNSDWSGAARDAYISALGAQSSAATRIGSIAASTQINLIACAAAGLTFYLALAAVLVKLIAAAVTALAAFGSGVFSWAGAAIILEEAGVNTAIIGAALATLTAFLGLQVTAMINLHSDAIDPTSFPRGAWPHPHTEQYHDATVTDGDADWSLQGD